MIGAECEIFHGRSGREVDQFCFGSVNTEAKPEYGRLDSRDRNCWSKEGVSSAWR